MLHMTSQNAMDERAVGALIHQFNIVVPEIQREYVWGFNRDGVFANFIADLIKSFQQSQTVVHNNAYDKLQQLYNASDEEIKAYLYPILIQQQVSLSSVNIGFIYSYRPDYYLYNDREEDVFLIDGQQRFTTLFLVLFYLALKEGRKNEFLHTFRYDWEESKMAFDYRVRSSTHDFLIDLIYYIDSVEDLLQIRDKTWFSSKYHHDTTILSSIGGKTENGATVQGAFALIHEQFAAASEDYYDFILNQVTFWHFKTEETSQGEELYITMNSRGQQLVDNEEIRAFLFAQLSDKHLYWSGRWEVWQDFFWKRRNKNNPAANADKGFNEFLRWVQLLAMTAQLNGESLEVQQHEQEQIEQVLSWEERKLDVKFLSLQDIENTFSAIEFLYEDLNLNIEETYPGYAGERISKMLPENWLRPEEGYLKQIECFRLLPVLEFCKKMLQEKVENKIGLFRFLRFLYNLHRDENLSKSVAPQCIATINLAGRMDIHQDTTQLLKMQVSNTLLNAEERLKQLILSNSDERMRLEKQFWFGEDLKITDGNIHQPVRFILNGKGYSDFSANKFEKFIKVYDKLSRNEQVFGELLYTDAFDEEYDRVVRSKRWHRSLPFLELCNELSIAGYTSLESVFINRRKSFVKKYADEAALMAEPSSKNQLYIYYILHKHVLTKTLWNWDDHFNLGRLLATEKYKDLFDNGYVYQLFKKAFHANEWRILPIHAQIQNRTKIIQHLFNWAREEEKTDKSDR